MGLALKKMDGAPIAAVIILEKRHARPNKAIRKSIVIGGGSGGLQTHGYSINTFIEKANSKFNLLKTNKANF